MPCSLNRTCIILVCASWHIHACVFTMLFASFRLCSFLIVSVSLRLGGFVRLRGIVFFMDSFFFLAGFQARWPLPSISLLSLLASCFVLSLCRRYLSLVYHTSQIAMSASNLFTLPSKPLFGYVTTLLSPSYGIASCRCNCRLFHVGTCISWDIRISLI